jgi:hypothetical protein
MPAAASRDLGEAMFRLKVGSTMISLVIASTLIMALMPRI